MGDIAEDHEYWCDEYSPFEDCGNDAHSLIFNAKPKTLTKKDDTFGTPLYLFDPLHEEFNFSVDAFADHSNALLPKYWTEEEDGYKQSWTDERVFANPPYSRGNVEKCFLKARDETRSGDCKVAVLLIPTYTERWWFHQHKHECEIRFIDHRIKFVGGATGARGCHMICVFRSHKWAWW